MKKAAIKSIVFIVTFFTVFASATAAVFADNAATTVNTTISATAAPGATTPAATTPAAVTPATTDGSISIAPDSVLYPLKLMVESVQTALTFNPEGKAELLVSFANKRLAEADLMNERNKQELVLSVMQAYVKTINEAGALAQESADAKTAQDVKPILDSIQITEQTADNFVIKVTGTVPQNISDQLKAVVADEVKKTIVNEAAQAAKDKVKEASQQVRVAEKQLAIAQQTGSNALVKAATDTLAAAQISKNDASALKKQVKAYRKQIVHNIKQQEAAIGIGKHGEDEDENDKSDEHDDKSENLKDNIKHNFYQDKYISHDRNDDQDEQGDEND